MRHATLFLLLCGTAFCQMPDAPKPVEQPKPRFYQFHETRARFQPKSSAFWLDVGTDVATAALTCATNGKGWRTEMRAVVGVQILKYIPKKVEVSYK